MRATYSAALIAALALPLFAQTRTGSTAFVDVNVVPMDGERILEHQTVIVRDQRIVALGGTDDVNVPAGSTRIDGRGKYLMPGLAEMHGHLPLPSPRNPRYSDDTLFLYVANGITTVRGMQGRPPHIEMRAKLESGELLGPRIYVAGPSMSGRIATPEAGAQLVRDYHGQGFDLLKIHEGISVEVYDAIASTAREVGIEFAGHVPDAVGVFRAVDHGQITVDHLDNMYDAVDGDTARIDELVELLQRNSAWVVPTEVLWETAFLTAGDAVTLREGRPEVRYVPAQVVDGWSRSITQRGASVDVEDGQRRIQFRRQLIKAISDAGGGMLLGTDSPQIFSVPGFSLHREMKLMVDAGMTPYEVLASGTSRVAEYFGTEADDGTITVGKRADLILVNANPLDDVAHVADRTGVMVNGRWLAEDEIQTRLREIAQAYSDR